MKRNTLANLAGQGWTLVLQLAAVPVYQDLPTWDPIVDGSESAFTSTRLRCAEYDPETSLPRSCRHGG